MAKLYDDLSVSFYSQLQWYYKTNKGIIRRRYRDLSLKFLNYNSKKVNENAFLRKPQYEALEMYIFLKEFMHNPQVSEMFKDWSERKGIFADSSFYAPSKSGTLDMFASLGNKQTEAIFKEMKKYQESYPNYIFSLTMGLGKTILMATCIFYEFLLAKKFPKDPLYCHNVLVFAPDKTVLESLREIQTFDKSKVVPAEYISLLDSNIKFHFLDGDSASLQTIDGSDFNIIISNTQKIIVKKKQTESSATDLLFGSNSALSMLYGNKELNTDDVIDESMLIENQRFKKICRLPQLGVYVDEAHHLFGADLEKSLHLKDDGKTSLRRTINMIAEKTGIVACYNYTGTPYVNKQLLPEVVYAYGLKESINNGFLKDAEPKGIENVKDKDFLVHAISNFWKTYSSKKYEGLNPKLAIFAATVDEAVNEVKPIVEEILTRLNISIDKILVNVGDSKYTKNTDIKNFNELDIPGSEGNEKQFIILVGKGREGWNCRSLLGIAMFRDPKSKNMILQSTMRCLRQLSDEQLTAQIYLSQSNFKILEDELNKNFNMDIKDLGNQKVDNKRLYNVRVLPPPIYIRVPKKIHNYYLVEKQYKEPIDFGLKTLDVSKYQSVIYRKDSIASDSSIKVSEFKGVQDVISYSIYTLSYEISKFLNLSPILVSKILTEAKDGTETILEYVNKYNGILHDELIPKVFRLLFEVKSEVKETEETILLLKKPKDKDYYEMRGDHSLVIEKDNESCGIKALDKNKSFHADTYIFDSNAEKELFYQYISNSTIKKVYFTGMFTSEQSGLRIQYFDPEAKRLRYYYPDFFAELEDGKYQVIEVKGDDKLEDPVVLAKKAAAEEFTASTNNAVNMEYVFYPASQIRKTNVLKDKDKQTELL